MAMSMKVVFLYVVGKVHVDYISSNSCRYVQQLYYKKEYTHYLNVTMQITVQNLDSIFISNN